MKHTYALLAGAVIFVSSSLPLATGMAKADEPPPFVPGERAPIEPGGTGADELGLTPADYAASIDYDVSYDDTVAQSYDDGYDPQASDQFRDALAPYGSWVDDPDYGQVWVPSQAEVGDDFAPYATNGDWVDSEYGWTWASGWSWGWAPFHYGRWATIGGYGWAWIPGTIWGPSWVSWRVGGGCVGWAPLPPRGVGMGSPLGPRSPWRFMAASNFGHVRGAYLPWQSVPRVFGRMSVVSNARSLGGGASPGRVNAGPVLRGQPPASQLASAAPSALPRFAVRAHAGTPVASRSWVQAGVTQQAAFMRGNRGSYTVTGRVPAGDGRSYTVGSGLGRGPVANGPGAMPNRAPYGTASAAGFGSAPVARPFGAGYRAPAYSAAPRWQGAPAPRFTAPTPRFSAPTAGFGASAPRFNAPAPRWQSAAPAPHFNAPAPRWQSAAPAPHFSAPAPAPAFHGGGGGRSFGGAAPSFGGGGHSFGGGGNSFGGGHRR